MKSPLLILIALFLCLSQTTLSAQVLNNKRVIVTFKPLTPAAYADSLRRSLSGGHVSEIGNLCLTDTRLWLLPDTADVLNVIGTISGGGRTHVVDTDQPNYEMPSHEDAQNAAPFLSPALTVGLFDSVPNATNYPNSIYFNNLLHPACAAGAQQTLIAIIDAGLDPIHAASATFRRHLYEPSFDNGCCVRLSGFGYDFVNNLQTPVDSNGHGTFVTSELVQLLESWGDNTTKLMILKVIAANGKGNTWNVIRALEKAACSGAKIVNMSIAGTRLKQPDSLNVLKSMMKYYGDNYKMLFVVGAGNFGSDYSNFPNSEIFPASFNLPNMICVAADSIITTLAKFSNYDTQGGAVHLAAPGVKVYGATLGGKFKTASGTSVAAPIVSAIAAFYASRRTTAEFDVSVIRTAIQKSLWTIDINRPAYPQTAWHGLAWLYCRIPLTASPTRLLSTAAWEKTPAFFVSSTLFHESLTVHFAPDTEGVADLRITDVMGKVVLSKTIQCQKGDNTFTWSPESALPHGLYIIAVNKDEVHYYEKVVKY